MIERLMKKCVVIVVWLFCQGEHLASVSALSANTHSENWVLLNFQYGFFFKNLIIPDATADNQFDSLGVGVTAHRFDNWGNFGGYFHLYFLFPGKVVSTKTGGLITTDEKIDTLIGLIIGPSFRFNLGNDSHFYFGAGGHVNYIGGSYTAVYPGISGSFQYDLNGCNIGVGGEFGFKYDTSEILHLSFGVVWTMDFWSMIFLSDPNRAVPKYAWLNIKPFIGIGFTVTSDHSWYVRIENEEY
jgi:hypothetical protein